MRGGAQKNLKGPVLGMPGLEGNQGPLSKNMYALEAPNLNSNVFQRLASRKVFNKNAALKNQTRKRETLTPVLNTTPALNSADLEEEYYDSIPIHELNFEVPMPFIPVSTHEMPVDEYNNESLWTYTKLLDRGNWYLKNFPEKFPPFDPVSELPTSDECLGFLFTMAEGPVVFEFQLMGEIPVYKYFRMIYEQLNSSYEPIYVLTKDEAVPISAEQVKEAYPIDFEDMEQKYMVR